MPAARLGIFGGTFDPPHLGHLVVAVQARKLLGLDRVLWVVANDPWQKSAGREISPGSARVEMVRAAISGWEGQEVCETELARGGPTYTIDTVRELDTGEGGPRPVLILGWDAAVSLPTWHRADELAELVDVAVVRRSVDGAGATLPDEWCTDVLDVPAVDVSSSDLRARFADGRPLDVLVADGVVSVATRHGLYGVRR